jgi:hypothetical protein
VRLQEKKQHYINGLIEPIHEIKRIVIILKALGTCLCSFQLSAQKVLEIFE